MPGGTWNPGQIANTGRVFNENITVNGFVQAQKGFASFPPNVTTPSTVPSPGTVFNTTGYDCFVYSSATTQVGVTMVFPGTTVALGGTASPGLGMSFHYVPAGCGIAITYTGNLTWSWLAV